MAEKSARTRASGKPAEAKAAKSTKAKTVKKAAATKAAPKTAKKKATFKLQAPGATQVYVAGCFNDWDATANPLEQDDEGVWTCTLLVEPGEHEYRFVVDGVWWDDPLNTMRRLTEYGCENCILIV